MQCLTQIETLYQIGIRSLVATLEEIAIEADLLYQIGIRSLVATTCHLYMTQYKLYQIGIRSLVATRRVSYRTPFKLYQIGITGQWITKNERKDPTSPECRCELGFKQLNFTLWSSGLQQKL